MFRIACVIPTYNGKFYLERLLSSLNLQTENVDILIIDSSSIDGTFEIGEKVAKKINKIPTSEFNHGGTRQLMIEQNPDYDIYVFITQDAFLADDYAIEKLVKPFADVKVGAVYGRQLPHLDANPLAQHARCFNYPATDQVKTMDDVPVLGLKTAFLSNSFAAYRGDTLRAIGGFPNNVIFAEDMYVAAKMLMSGWKVVYAANALCRHSHNYSIKEEFSRYFDMGVFHSRESWIRECFGSASGEGIKYVKSEIKFLGIKRIHMWPSATFRNFVKFLGYKLGVLEDRIPIKIKKILSMHKKYWEAKNLPLI